MGITIISGDVEDPKQGSKNLKSKVVSSYKKREQDIDKKYADPIDSSVESSFLLPCGSNNIIFFCVFSVSTKIIFACVPSIIG